MAIDKKFSFIRDPFRTNEFVVEIDGQNFVCDKVSGLKLGETGTVEQYDNQTNAVYKVSSGVVKWPSLTLETAFCGKQNEKNILEWWKETFNIANSGVPGSDGTYGSSSSRRNLNIIKYHFGQVAARWLVKEAWLKSVEFSELEAGSENVFKITVVLEHEGLELILS
ncbi:MAG: hypothetical protein D6805_05625 [Planctomycetota bacterium]|nr:MAG: hypothetical protein D6805_05625 [Planctomycetota bacterium]